MKIMNLKENEYTPQLQDIFTSYKSIGVVLNICVLNFDEIVNTEKDLQKSAIFGMQIFAKRYLERLIAMNPDSDVSQYFQIKIDENIEPKGTKIGYREFLGTGFDFENRRVNLFDYSENSKSSGVFEGLAHALLDPPYKINLGMRDQKLSVEYGIEEQKRMTEFLLQFLEQILLIKEFSGFEKLEIYSWSDDWSNYFNAGKEWWGTFFWTILNRKQKTITVIGGSSTD